MKTFFTLFQQTRDYILSQMAPVQQQKDRQEKRVERFMLLMAALWFLQRQSLFLQDKDFFLSLFHNRQQYRQISPEPNEKFLFGKIMHYLFIHLFSLEKDSLPSPFKSLFGQIVPLGSVLIQDGQSNPWDGFCEEYCPDHGFYLNSSEEKGLNKKNGKGVPASPIVLKTLLKGFPQGVPLFNMFEIIETLYGSITEFMIGALFEKILTQETKDATGAYYTPENICNYIANNAILSSITADKDPKIPLSSQKILESVLNSLDTKESIKLIKILLHRLLSLKILDPAVGSGHFLSAIIHEILDTFRTIWKFVQKHNQEKIMSLSELVDPNIQKIWADLKINPLEMDDFEAVTYYLKRDVILPQMIFALDINPNAVIITRLRLFLVLFEKGSAFGSIPASLLNIETCNTLNPIEYPGTFPAMFDIIIGNPPYGNLLDNTQKHQVQAYVSYSNEIASVFIERTLPMLNPGGTLIFILTYAICFSKDLSPVRAKLAKNFGRIRLSTFDRDKCRFFEGMTQSVTILQCSNRVLPVAGKNDYCLIETSAMYRTMPELGQLKHQVANEFLLGSELGVSFEQDHRLPKIGYKNLTILLQEFKNLTDMPRDSRLRLVGETLSSWSIIRSQVDEQKIVGQSFHGKEGLIWVRISGNYWYNAWDRAPYYGTQIAIASIRVSVPFIREFLLILINSSFYYVWFRVFSDGRHMNSDILRALPLPDNLESKLEKNVSILKKFTSILMQTLFAHFDPDYARFQSSEIKGILDVCDCILGELYEFSPDLIDFIQNFEPEIRGGKQIKPEVQVKVRKIFQLAKGDKSKPETLDKAVEEFSQIMHE